jgi:prophage regulatory protein
MQQHARRKKKSRRRAYDPTAEIIRARDLRSATGLHPVTVWRLRRAGKFPEPIRLGVQAIGWRRAEIERWLDSLGRRPQAGSVIDGDTPEEIPVEVQ